MWPISNIAKSLLSDFVDQDTQVLPGQEPRQSQSKAKLIDFLGAKTARQNLEWWTKQSVFSSTKCCFGDLDSAWLDSDSLIVRGWIFHHRQAIQKLELVIRGIAYRVVLKTELRADVKVAFPAEKHALRCGFYLVLPWTGKRINKISPSFKITFGEETVIGHFKALDIITV